MNREIEKIIFLIFSAGRIIKGRASKVGKHNFLLHARVIDFVNENKSPTMKQLSDFLCVKSPTATAVVSPLIRSGKVKRISDKLDNRIVRLNVTKIGKKFLQDCKRQLVSNLRADLTKINGKDRRDLIRILEKLI